MRFRYGGRSFKRSLGTGKEKLARAQLGRIEETLILLRHGRLTIPPGADPAAFILSDGRKLRDAESKLLTLAVREKKRSRTRAVTFCRVELTAAGAAPFEYHSHHAPRRFAYRAHTCHYVPMQSQSLKDQLRALRFAHRLDQARLVENHAECGDRTKAAVAIIREIAMQRVFDRLTKKQETELLDILWPLAHPDGTKRPAIFSDVAKDRLDTRRTDLSRQAVRSIL